MSAKRRQPRRECSPKYGCDEAEDRHITQEIQMAAAMHQKDKNNIWLLSI